MSNDIGKIIHSRRIALGLTLEEVGNAVGVGKSTVKKWEDGYISNMKRDKIALLADVLQVSPVTFITGTLTSKHTDIPPGFSPLPHTVKRPRLGRISCGEPIDSPENFDGYDDVPDYVHCDFTLECEGDSMIGARIHDGDIVYIKQQPVVENGQIAAILIDGTEKLLKRVYFTEDSITLQAENPAYPPLAFFREDMNRVSIIGKAVGFYSKIK